MSSRLPVCEMCRNFPGEYNFCPITARCCRDDYLYESCSDFEQKALPTVFDQITASPEVLANFLVFHNRIYKGRTKYHSAVVGGEFDSYEEALSATVAKLKEFCVEQNGNDDTQTNLCKVNDTQKEVAE